MEVGIMIAATAETGAIAEIAREAENLGYDSLFIPEHPVIPIGFKTTVHPAANAGATLQTIWFSGQFQGVISAATPIASLTMRLVPPSRLNSYA